MAVYDSDRSPHLWFKALDIASRRIRFAEPSELALDQFYWMKAFDFDVSFVKDGLATLGVYRDRLANADRDATLTDWTHPLPTENCFSDHLSLNDAFSHLDKLPWLVLMRDGQVVGIITHDDLKKPAATALVDAHLASLQQALWQLVGSYTNHPIHDGRKEGDLSRVLGEVKNIPELCAELGCSDHEMSVIEACPTRLIQFQASNKLMLRALEMIENRDQVWSAYGDSVIVDKESSELYAGPNSVGLPFYSPCFVITACNPREQVFDRSINRLRNDMLRKSLELRTDKIRLVVSQSRCGKWTEESFLVSDIEERAIVALAAKYEQRAVFRLEEQGIFVIDEHGDVKAQRSRSE